MKQEQWSVPTESEGSSDEETLQVLTPEERRTRQRLLRQKVGLEAAKKAIDDSLHEDVPMRTFARISGFHHDTFTRMFRDSFGETPVTYRVRCRLERARLLLVEQPEWSVRRVAAECGFHNLSYFYRQFQKHFGHTPTSIEGRVARRPNTVPPPAPTSESSTHATTDPSLAAEAHIFAPN